MFLKNKNIIFKIRRSKVTDYAALKINGDVKWRQVWLVADTSEDVNCGNFDDLKEMRYY